MPGWLELTLADGRQFAVEMPGEATIDIPQLGGSRRLCFTQQGLLKAEWSAEEPSWAPGDGPPPWAPGPDYYEEGAA